MENILNAVKRNTFKGIAELILLKKSTIISLNP